MPSEEHSTLREGIVTGLIGAAIVAVWYFVFDLAAGRPFYTPNVLGKIFFHGDVNPGTRAIVPGAVIGYTVLHLVISVLVGLGLTLLTHLAARNLALRMGVWIGLVMAFLLFSGLIYALAVSTGERLPLWEVLGGAVLGVAGMAWYLLGRHPNLRHSLKDVPLGDEVRSPAHPSGRR